MPEQHEVTCKCGKVRLALAGRRLLSTKCHCTSCRSASERLQALPGLEPMEEADGGTPFVLYRKDRVRFESGAPMLGEFRLTPQAPTRRVVALCCNTPVFLEFESGHWLSLYSHLWPEAERPRPDIRTMMEDQKEGRLLGEDIKYGWRQTWGFYGKLLGAWIAMGFRTPKMPDISRTTEA